MFADKPSPFFFKLAERVKKADKFFQQNKPNIIPEEFINPIVIVKDSCNFSISYAPPEQARSVAGNNFLRLPKFTIYGRNKNCQPPPPPPPPQKKTGIVVVDRDKPVCESGIPMMILRLKTYQERAIYKAENQSRLGEGKTIFYKAKEEVTLGNVKYPVEYIIPQGQPESGKKVIGARVTLKVLRSVEADGLTDLSGARLPGFRLSQSRSVTKTFDVWQYSADLEPIGSGFPPLQIAYFAGYSFPVYGFNFRIPDVNDGSIDRECGAIFGRENAMLAWEVIQPIIARNEETSTPFSKTVRKGYYQLLSICGDTAPPPPQPPPPPKECDCMQCCPDVSGLESLLKIIIKRIGEPQKVTIFDEDLERKGTQKTDKTPESLNHYFKLVTERVEIVNRLLGIDNYPMTVPDTMITPFQEGPFAKIFKFIDGKKKRNIKSVTELIAWMSEQDSAVLGEFHQVIKFEGEDKKEKQLVIPNIAEALKEIVLLTSQMAKQNNVQTELIFKIAAETLATRAAASKGVAIVQDIQDYLDYPTERKTTTIPSSMSLPKITTNKEGIPIATGASENHNNFLKPGDIKFIYEDWTGANSLHDQMLDLLQLASMLRAIYFQRTDKE